jgi:isopentenyl-diphosphate delta-isomerase
MGRHGDAKEGDAKGFRVTEKRKSDHIDIVAKGMGTYKKTTWLEFVELLPGALPDFSLSDISTTLVFLSRRFSLPIFISGMTGGTERSKRINLCLAKVASRFNVPLGIGSQRAMLENESVAHTYMVKEFEPDIFLAGNIGVTSLKRFGARRIREALKRIGADCVCIHINPLQEVLQNEGDKDFSGCLDAIKDALDTLDCPVIVKEVGCGFSRKVLLELKAIGVQVVDVAGAGGTSFAKIELVRAGLHERAEFQGIPEFGIPTAVALLETQGLGLDVIGSGGIRSGLDVVKVLALGAKMAGIGAPFLQVLEKDGEEGVFLFMEHLTHAMKSIMFSLGCRGLEALRNVEKLFLEPLRGWHYERTTNRTH